MNSLLENIKDLLENPRDWPSTIKFYIISKFMPQKEKNAILIQAKNQAEDILTKNGLNIPFKVDLEDTKDDIKFRTIACYERGSSERGIVKIYIKSYLIGKDIDRVVHCILHEYSHGIYEEGFTTNSKLGLEISKLMEYTNPHLPQEREEIIFDSDHYHSEKEKFCDWFASYLMNRNSENKEIENICENIIQKYIQNRTNRFFFAIS